MNLKKATVLGGALALVLAAATTTVRAYRVAGGSDAPAYLSGDLLLVNRAAYRIPLPFVPARLARLRIPARGDVVLVRVPRDGRLVFKVVVGLPGERVAIASGRVVLDGVRLEYAPLDRSRWDGVPAEDDLGPLVAREVGAGLDQVVSLGPAREEGASGPVTVPPDHLFVLGSNRPHSRDSRHFGPVPLDDVEGRVVLNLSALRRERRP